MQKLCINSFKKKKNGYKNLVSTVCNIIEKFHSHKAVKTLAGGGAKSDLSGSRM